MEVAAALRSASLISSLTHPSSSTASLPRSELDVEQHEVLRPNPAEARSLRELAFQHRPRVDISAAMERVLVAAEWQGMRVVAPRPGEMVEPAVMTPSDAVVTARVVGDGRPGTRMVERR